MSDTGKLETVDLNITSQGAIKVRKADWTLGEDDKKLRVIGLDVSEDFQQTGGVLGIRNQGQGRIPFFQIGSGLATNANFNFDSATTLSVPFIKLNTSFLLTSEYAASCGFVLQAYQSQVNTGVDILEPVNNRRIIKIRTDPSFLHVEDTTNNLSVKIDPSGALKKDLSLGLDLKIDPSGSIKLDPGLGIDVKLDPSGVIKNDPALGLDVRTDPSGGLKKDVGLGLDVRTDPSGAVKVDPGLGLDVKLFATGGIQNIPGGGLAVKWDPLGPLFRDLAGLDIRLAPTGGLQKSTAGLACQVDPSGALSIDGILGLDVKVDHITIGKGLAGLQGLYKAGNKLQIIGNIISLLPEVEDAIDKVDEVAEGLDEVKDTIGDLQDATDTLGNRLNNLDPPSTGVPGSDVMGKAASGLSTAAQAGISAGAGFLGGASGGALTAGSMGYTALNAAKTMAAGKALGAIAAGLGAIFAAAIGGGLIGAKAGKTVINNTYVGGNGISHGGLDNDSDKAYLYGYSAATGFEWNKLTYPDKTTSPCCIMPLLGSDPALSTVGSTSSTTGMLTVAGGCGVLENIYAGGSIFSNNQKVATESFVSGKNYITSANLTGLASETYVNNRGFITDSALSPYLTTETAASTYLTIANASSQYTINPGTGLTKTGNTLSVNTTQPQITQVGRLSSLETGLVKAYQQIQSWQTTLTMPTISMQATKPITTRDTAPIGYLPSDATLSNIDNVNTKLLKGTTTFNGMTIPTLYAGNYEVEFHTWQVRFDSAQNIGFLAGVAIVRNGAVAQYIQYGDSGFWNVNGGNTNGSVFAHKDIGGTKTITVQDGDAVTVYINKNGNSTTWNCQYDVNSFLIKTGFPTLNAWDFTGNSLSFYPDIRNINRVESTTNGFTFSRNIVAPNVYDKTYIDSTVASLNTAINGKQPTGDYAVNSTFNNYYNKSYIDTTVATLNTSINGKQTAGDYALNSAFNNYYNKSYIDTTLGNYYTKTSIDSTFSNYYTKTSIDSTVATLNTSINGKQPTGDYALNSAFNNYYNKTQVDAALAGKQVSGDFATNTYVNQQLGTKLNLSGGTMTGNLNMQPTSGLPTITLSGNGGAGNSTSIFMSPWGGRTGGASVKLLAIDNGDSAARFELHIASGSSAAPATKVFTAYQNWCTFEPTLSINNNLYVKQNGGGGSIKVAPTNNGSESSIAFYKNSDFTVNCWVLGQNSYGSGDSFCVGCEAFDAHTYFDTNGTVRVVKDLNVGSNLTMGGNLVGTQSWVNTQGFIRSVGGNMSLTPTAANGTTSVSFSTNPDNSGMNFAFGRGIRNLGMDYMAIGHDTASAQGWTQCWDRFGSSKIAVNLSVGFMLTMDSNKFNPPFYTSRSDGTKIILHPNISQNTVDYAFGTETNSMWLSVPGSANSFKFYAGTNVIGTLAGGGLLTVPSISVSGTSTFSEVLANINGQSGSVSINFNNPTWGTFASLAASGSSVTSNVPFIVNGDTLRTNGIVWDWADLRNSSGGGFQVNTKSIFNKTVLFSGKTAGVSRDGGQYRYHHYNGSGYSGGTDVYGAVFNSRVMISPAGAQMDVFSDQREKEQVVSMNDKTSYNVVKNVRSVGFKYKPDQNKQQRYGWLAQELLSAGYMKDLLSIYKMDSTTERYVLNEVGVNAITYSALRALIAEHERLKVEHDKLREEFNNMKIYVDEAIKRSN
ncbi:hypothetical protein HDV00_009322, partial [Rhizophlyctis rosea]